MPIRYCPSPIRKLQTNLLRHVYQLRSTQPELHTHPTAMSNIPEHHLNSTKTLFGNPWDAQTREEECNEISPNTSNSSWLQNLNILPSILTDLPVERAKDFSNHKIISKIVVKPDFSGYLKGGYNLKATWLGHAVCHFTLPKYTPVAHVCSF